MSKYFCKTCGAEILVDPTWAGFFKEGPDTFNTCKSCEEKARLERKTIAEKERAEHPEWHDDGKTIFPQ